VEALEAAPSWTDVVAEIALPESRGALRPVLRATQAASCVVVWADSSVTTTFAERAMPEAAASPLRPVTAFTPLVWEAYGRIGPATRRWQGAALGEPQRAGARATLLRRVSVALWRSQSRAVAIGYSRCLGAAAEDARDGEGGLLGSSSLGAHIVE